MKLIRSAIFFSLLIMLPIAVCSQVFAEIAIGPLTKTVQIAPGDSKTVAYKVANRGDEQVALNITAKTWFTLPGNADIGIDDWLDIGKAKINLAPGAERDLEFKVNVPKQATGELAAMIYFTPERKEEQNIGTSYGVSLYIFIKGTEVIDPAIDAVSIDKNNDKAYLAVTIKNNGNVHFRPKISAVIKVGKDFKEKIDFPFGKPIYGGTKYTFTREILAELSKTGMCTIEVSCNYADSKDTVLNKVVDIDLSEVKDQE